METKKDGHEKRSQFERSVFANAIFQAKKANPKVICRLKTQQAVSHANLCDQRFLCLQIKCFIPLHATSWCNLTDRFTDSSHQPISLPNLTTFQVHLQSPLLWTAQNDSQGAWWHSRNLFADTISPNASTFKHGVNAWPTVKCVCIYMTRMTIQCINTDIYCIIQYRHIYIIHIKYLYVTHEL